MKISLPITVIAFETDFGGVVSNTRYLEYLERGRHALVHAAGMKVLEIWESQGVQPVVRRTEIDYLGFARYEDDLELTTWVESHSGATTTLRHELVRPADGAIIVRAVQTLAYLNNRWKPSRVPAVYRDAFAIDTKENA